MRHKKAPIDLKQPGLDESLLRDLDSVKLIPPNDPKLLAAKKLLNDAKTATHPPEGAQAGSQEVQAKAKDVQTKLLKTSDGTPT